MLEKSTYRNTKYVQIHLNRLTANVCQALHDSLSDSDTYDLVIQFFLEKKVYDIHLVNQALD